MDFLQAKQIFWILSNGILAKQEQKRIDILLEKTDTLLETNPKEALEQAQWTRNGWIEMRTLELVIYVPSQQKRFTHHDLPVLITNKDDVSFVIERWWLTPVFKQDNEWLQQQSTQEKNPWTLNLMARHTPLCEWRQWTDEDQILYRGESKTDEGELSFCVGLLNVQLD